MNPISILGGQHPQVLKVYSWLSVQESFLVGLEPNGVPGD